MTFTFGMKVAVFVMTLGAAALAADLIWMVPGRIPVHRATTPAYQADTTDATTSAPTHAAAAANEQRKAF